MADFSHLFGPLNANAEAERAGAPRPDEIVTVLRTWRSEGLAVELPKQKSAEAQRRQDVMGQMLREFPVNAMTRSAVYHCAACPRTITLKDNDARLCPVCGGEVEERPETEVFELGESYGATFVSPGVPSFHLSVETLMRTLDLPRWFLDLGAHMRQMRRLPVNLANFGIATALGILIPLCLIGLIQTFRVPVAEKNFWRMLGYGGFFAIIGLLALRPMAQSYVIVGREKLMHTVFGQRQVLHFQHVTRIRNDRRLSGWGYALVLGRRYGDWAKWLYGILLQWFDPRAWFGQYDRRLIQELPAEAGVPGSAAFRNRIILQGPRNTIRLPYNPRLRRDLTQALAVAIFQVRSMSPGAKIDLAALQVAQKERATIEQWQSGVRG